MSAREMAQGPGPGEASGDMQGDVLRADEPVADVSETNVLRENALQADIPQAEALQANASQTDTPQTLYLRPHHGLCILNYRGHGYSDAFSVRMEETTQILREHPGTRIEIAHGCDSLCAVCPHREGTSCTSVHPDLFDQNVLAATGYTAGQVVPWSELSAATDILRREHLAEMCPDCGWLELCREIVLENATC